MSEAQRPSRPLALEKRRAFFAATFSAAALSAAVLAGSAWVTGCGRSTSPTSGGTGSQTGWLRSCNTTTDCEVGDCLCGVCSQWCAEDSECRALDSSASCALASSVSSCSVASDERLCVSGSATGSSSSGDAEGTSGASAGGSPQTAGEAGSGSTSNPEGGNVSTTPGGSSSSDGEDSNTNGGQSSTAGSGGMASVGGSPSNAGGESGASGVEEFPWPELPEGRGVVAVYEPWDASESGCCTRFPGSEPNDYCPPGVESRLAQVIPSNGGAVVGTTFDLDTDNGPVVVTFDSPVAVTIGVMETELVPPEGIVDMSPVYWVGGTGETLPDRFMVLLQSPGYGITVKHPGEQAPQIYHSPDGAEYEPLETGPLMYTAYLGEPGFIVLGAGPDTIQCQLD